MLESANKSISKESFRSYQYEDLPQGYIRLVHIKPGKPEDPLELELNSIRFRPFWRFGFNLLKYVPRYEALSYTWDDNGKKLPVIVNGQSFYIIPNLHSALHAIRHNDGNAFSLPFWIDAICIDQDDEVEKEQQLKIMHLIYKNATNVRIWLGSDDQSVDVRAASTLISHCLTKFEQVRGRSNAKLESDWDFAHAPSLIAFIKRAIFRLKALMQGIETDFEKIDWHTAPEDSSGWKAIKNILTGSYFTRSWIIQEMVLASNRSIFVGDCNVTDIFHFVELLYANPKIEEQLPVECRIEPEVTSRIHHLIRNIVTYSAVRDLGKLLADFRGKCSTKPHDQVYSLLGLVAMKNASLDEEERFPEVKYEQSIQKLCTDTTRYIVTRNDNLDVLRMLNTHAKPTSEKTWPSWVPDFTSPLPGLGEAKSSKWMLPPRHLLRTELPREKTDIRIEDDKLLVHGHVLSEIRERIEVLEVKSSRRRNADEARLSAVSPPEFRPMSVWRDSEGRKVRGVKGMAKGDLVVMVPRSESPLILRRRKDGARAGKRTESAWPEYHIVGTAYMPGINFDRLATEIVWDFQKMAIV
ncbi:hypothetical protein ACMFMG_000901 [Clarireedia jacksonii]